MVGNPLIGNPEAVIPVAMPAFTVELKNVRLLKALLDDMLNLFLYIYKSRVFLKNIGAIISECYRHGL
jgi:hypothetical protein